MSTQTTVGRLEAEGPSILRLSPGKGSNFVAPGPAKFI